MASELHLDSLTIKQKLQLVDELWLSMGPDLDSLEVSSEEKALLDERWASFLSDTTSALTLEEFQLRMRANRS